MPLIPKSPAKLVAKLTVEIPGVHTEKTFSPGQYDAVEVRVGDALYSRQHFTTLITYYGLEFE